MFYVFFPKSDEHSSLLTEIISSTKENLNDANTAPTTAPDVEDEETVVDNNYIISDATIGNSEVPVGIDKKLVESDDSNTVRLGMFSDP